MKGVNVLVRPSRSVLRLPLRALRSIRRHFSRVPADKWLITVAAAVGLGHLLWLTKRETVPYTHRKHAIIIPHAIDRVIGNAMFNEVKKHAIENHTLLPASHPYSKRVRQIGTRIAEVAGSLGEGSCGHMRGLQWEFVVVQSNTINAFVLPGGKVVVYTGLIKLMNRNDELAAVLAHEVAHVVARHAAERITEEGFLAYAQLFLNVLCDIELHPNIADVFLCKPHSRRAETEADVIGVHLMAKAGFDPIDAVAMLKKLEELERLGRTEDHSPLLRTHPMASDRVARVLQEIPRARIAYNASARGSRRISS